MGTDNFRVYHLLCYFSLVACTAMVILFSFVMQVTRKRDIDYYRLQKDFFATNIQIAVSSYLSHYITNKQSSAVSPLPQTPGQFPTVSYAPFGFSAYPEPTACFPGGVYFVRGDFCNYGYVQLVTERAIYCRTASNTVHIVRAREEPRPQAESALRAQPARADVAPSDDSYL